MWTKEENKWHIGIERWNRKQIKTLQKNQEQKFSNQNNRGQIQWKNKLKCCFEIDDIC